MKPISLTLAVKLGSLAVHVEEFFSTRGHPFDRAAVKTLLCDPEVRAFLDNPDHAAFFPVKRYR